MLPLTLLKVATGSPLLVELKGGDTYNGRLVSCDAWMNMNLRDVICTSRDGDRFWKLPSCYIRGSAIKYLRLPTDLLEKAQEEEERAPPARAYGGDRGGGYQRGTSPGRGGRGGRRGGGGRGPPRGGVGGRGPPGGGGGGGRAPTGAGGRGPSTGGRGRRNDSSEPRGGRTYNPNYKPRG